MVFLASDNTSHVHPQVMQAIDAANSGHAVSYGADTYGDELTQLFRDLFEHETLEVYPVFNGSAANCMALASMVAPYEAIISHHHSHIEQDEGGMPELFTSSKLMSVGGEHGKIDPILLNQTIELALSDGIHHPKPQALSMTQSTEFGTVYTPEEIAQLSNTIKAHQMHLHMDGARFANAVAHLGCTPAQTTWKCGVDVLSFGGTKNGAMMVEAVIYFNPDLATHAPRIRKRVGQLASKHRYLCAQLLGLLKHDLWLKNAAHANEMASELAAQFATIPSIKLLNTVQANSLFVTIPKPLANALKQAGHYFHEWPRYDPDCYRLVTSFATSREEIDQFISDIRTTNSSL